MDSWINVSQKNRIIKNSDLYLTCISDLAGTSPPYLNIKKALPNNPYDKVVYTIKMYNYIWNKIPISKGGYKYMRMYTLREKYIEGRYRKSKLVRGEVQYTQEEEK